MPVTDAFAEDVRGVLAPMGAIRIRRMFGGAGVYLDDAMFALLADDELYIKADATTRPAFEAAGASPFTAVMKGRTETMNYWRLPAQASEDPPETIRWARLGLEAALRARRPRKSKGGPAAAELGPGPWDEA